MFLHLLTHFLSGVLAGFIIWQIFKSHPFVSFFAGIIGGFFIDLDHWIDYFITFGFKINLDYFWRGYQFLRSGKIFIFFHGWEYVVVLCFLAWIFKNRKMRVFFLALALGMFFHLSFDTYINEMPVRGYSIIYRAASDFKIENIASSEKYQRHLKYRKSMGF